MATVSGGMQDSQLPHRVQHRTFPQFPSDHTPLLVRPHAQQQGVPLLTPRCPSGHTAGPGPAPLRAERHSLPQGLISVSEVEAKTPGAQCRIQIGIICGSVHILGARTRGVCLMREGHKTCPDPNTCLSVTALQADSLPAGLCSSEQVPNLEENHIRPQFVYLQLDPEPQCFALQRLLSLLPQL